MLIWTPNQNWFLFIWIGVWIFIKYIFRSAERVPLLQSEKAHRFIPYFQTFLLLWQFEMWNSYLPLSGLHHTSKAQQTLHEIYFLIYFLNDYSNKLCCPDVQNLYGIHWEGYHNFRKTEGNRFHGHYLSKIAT